MSSNDGGPVKTRSGKGAHRKGAASTSAMSSTSSRMRKERGDAHDRSSAGSPTPTQSSDLLRAEAAERRVLELEMKANADTRTIAQLTEQLAQAKVDADQAAADHVVALEQTRQQAEQEAHVRTTDKLAAAEAKYEAQDYARTTALEKEAAELRQTMATLTRKKEEETRQRLEDQYASQIADLQRRDVVARETEAEQQAAFDALQQQKQALDSTHSALVDECRRLRVRAEKGDIDAASLGSYRVLLRHAIIKWYMKEYLTKKKLAHLHKVLTELMLLVMQNHEAESRDDDSLQLLTMQSEIGTWYASNTSTKNSHKLHNTLVLLDHMNEVEGVLHCAIRQSQERSRKWKHTARSFCERNNTLRNKLKTAELAFEDSLANQVAVQRECDAVRTELEERKQRHDDLHAKYKQLDSDHRHALRRLHRYEVANLPFSSSSTYSVISKNATSKVNSGPHAHPHSHSHGGHGHHHHQQQHGSGGGVPSH